jgi:CheY-like chemotaxis protein/HPt (histidine-containing phosphotransfer) domain-containing protein
LEETSIERPEKKVEPEPDLRGRRALVIDGNQAARDALAARLLAWKLSVKTAATVEEARALVDPPVDFILLDPRVCAGDVEGCVKTLEDAGAAAPVILMKPLGLQVQPLPGGAVLNKPVHRQVLRQTLSSVISGTPVPVEDRNLEGDDTLPGTAPPILVVEDNATNQKVAVLMLRRLGYRPDVAANGLEAIEAVKRHFYPTVLMDVQMPEMDGLQATRQIRALAGITQPKIVALTAGAMPGDITRCREAGMDDYLRKPVRFEDLLAKLGRAINGAPKPESREVQEPHDQESSVAGETGKGADPGYEPTLDQTALQKMREMMPEIVNELVTEFLRDLPASMDAVALSVKTGALEQTASLAHKLRGSGGTIGARRLAALARELEWEAKAGSTGRAAEITGEMYREVDRLRSALEKEGGLLLRM